MFVGGDGLDGAREIHLVAPRVDDVKVVAFLALRKISKRKVCRTNVSEGWIVPIAPTVSFNPSLILVNICKMVYVPDHR